MSTPLVTPPVYEEPAGLPQAAVLRSDVAPWAKDAERQLKWSLPIRFVFAAHRRAHLAAKQPA